MKYLYFILFMLFNANGIDEQNVAVSDDTSMDKAFVVQGITMGVQSNVLDLDFHKSGTLKTLIDKYAQPAIQHREANTVSEGPHIPEALKRRMYFRSHPDDSDLPA